MIDHIRSAHMDLREFNRKYEAKNHKTQSTYLNNSFLREDVLRKLSAVGYSI